MHSILVQVDWPIEDLHSWASNVAVKASELLTAAQHTPVAIEMVIGVLLAATHGWPHWAHADLSPQPGRPPVQQLALVNALSHQLNFAAILQSDAVRYGYPHPRFYDYNRVQVADAFRAPRQWLAQEILCSAQTRSPHEQALPSLQQLVLETIVSELTNAASHVDGGRSIFVDTASRCCQCNVSRTRCSRFLSSDDAQAALPMQSLEGGKSRLRC